MSDPRSRAIRPVASLLALLVLAATHLTAPPVAVSQDVPRLSTRRTDTTDVSAGSGIPDYVPRTLQPTDLRAELQLLRQALEEVHAGWDRYTPRRVLDTAFARLERQAASPMTDLQFHREISLLLALMRCDHTKAELPEALDRYRREQPTFLPVRVRIIDGHMYVATGAEIPRGTEIRAINGVPSGEVISRLSRYVAVDGFTTYAKAARLESDDDLLGNDLDHYWPFEFGFAKRWTLDLIDAAGEARTEVHAPITYAQWAALSGDTEAIDFRNGTSWRVLDDSTALLTVRSFVNYRQPVSPDSVYGAIMRALRARGVSHLVVDLRENGGGSADASWGLVRHLINRPVTPTGPARRRTIDVSPTLRAAFETWGDPSTSFAPAPDGFLARDDGWFVERAAARTLTPAPDAFPGRVSLLTSRANSSGATMLLATLQHEGRATGRFRLVGEETGGSAEGPTAGQLLTLHLRASDIRVRIPLIRTDMNVPFVAGMGVFPDVDATESRDDLRAGRDRALLAARSTAWTPPAAGLGVTRGVMRGALTYRDYSNGRLVSIPTVQHVAPVALGVGDVGPSPAGPQDLVQLRLVYDDGPGKTLYAVESVRMEATRVIVTPSSGTPDTLRVASRRATEEGTELVLLGRGLDNDAEVEFRFTWTLSPTLFRRRKEYRAPGADDWSFRHEYELWRGPSDR